MNSFGVIDYKAPVGRVTDMRTSTYRAHWHLDDTMMGNKLHVKYEEPTRRYQDDPQLAKTRVSEHQANYNWKFSDPNVLRNPAVNTTLFIKPSDECKWRFIERPLRPACSIAQQDYVWKRREVEADTPAMRMPAAIAVTAVAIDRSKPGCAKHLDPSATTARLDYVAYSPEQLGGLAAQDHITYWNWDAMREKQYRVWRERDEHMCNNLAAKECPKRRCEFQCRVKYVPHSGLTTEVRANYLEPNKREVEHDVTHIRNCMTHTPVVPFSKKTEQNIIGSGERTQQYV